MAVVCAVLLVPAPALAADSVFWNWATITNSGTVANSGISVANLDGTGGHGLTISGTTVQHPLGIAIDSATGTMYWANFGGFADYCYGQLQTPDTISFAKLDGTGGGTLNTSGATVLGPDGVAIDPAAGRLYWANEFGNTISYANLDGSGGHDLNTAGATMNCPAGLAIDPAGGRVYWTNLDGNKISYANLNGTGGGDLPTGAATVNGPWGLAIDAAAGRVYWANNDGNTISYANLDGSGGQDLNTAGATVNGPWGVAVDPVAGRVYWANNLGGTISYANLNGSGGADLSTVGVPSDHPKYAALLETPAGTGAPVVTGVSTPGSTLSCSPGTWAPDLLGSFLYRAPESLSYTWSRDGVPVRGGSSSIVAGSPGSYSCRVTGSNPAGATTQASRAFPIAAAPSAALAVLSRTVSRGGAIRLAVRVPGAGALYAGAVFARRLVYGAAGGSTIGAGTVILAIRPGAMASRQLAAGRTLSVRVLIAFRGKDGAIGRTGTAVLVRRSP